MKPIRYRLLLPLIHLAISLPVIYHQEASTWPDLQRLQMEEDFERKNPEPAVHSGPMIEWSPCYEYRPSIADEVIALVEFPAGMLIPPHGGTACNPTLLRPLLQNLKRRIQVKTRIVMLDFLLLIGIASQWWFIGIWLDHLRQRHRPLKRWIIPAATITISGISGAGVAFEGWRPLQIGAAVLSLIAFLAWVILLLMFVVTAVRWAIRLARKAGTTEHS